MPSLKFVKRVVFQLANSVSDFATQTVEAKSTPTVCYKPMVCVSVDAESWTSGRQRLAPALLNVRILSCACILRRPVVFSLGSICNICKLSGNSYRILLPETNISCLRTWLYAKEAPNRCCYSVILSPLRLAVKHRLFYSRAKCLSKFYDGNRLRHEGSLSWTLFALKEFQEVVCSLQVNLSVLNFADRPRFMKVQEKHFSYTDVRREDGPFPLFLLHRF